MSSNPEEVFVGRLVVLAQLTKFDLTPEVIALYDNQLASHGYLNVVNALDQIIVGRDTRDLFPSIREILRCLGVSAPKLGDGDVQDINLADEAVDRIFRGIRKFGSVFPAEKLDEWREYMGNLCIEILKVHPLYDLGSVSANNLPTVRAQMRRSAVDIIRRHREGRKSPPELPSGPSRSQTFVQEQMDLAERNLKRVAPAK